MAARMGWPQQKKLALTNDFAIRSVSGSGADR
jgi:hypothetical protein